ncbi:MAG: thermonuclease family protein [Fastidiosipilaceae bacterium]
MTIKVVLFYSLCMKQYKRFKGLLLIVCLVGLLVGCDEIINFDDLFSANNVPMTRTTVVSEESLTDSIRKHPNIPPDVVQVEVERVVDGDTFIARVDGERERLRMIGIDTPESVAQDESRNTPEGVIASEFTNRYLDGATVYLEFDKEQRDQYGRLLVYVWMEDGSMFNRTLVREGYAKLMTRPPNIKYLEEFKSDRANAIQRNK